MVFRISALFRLSFNLLTQTVKQRCWVMLVLLWTEHDLCACFFCISRYSVMAALF